MPGVSSPGYSGLPLMLHSWRAPPEGRGWEAGSASDPQPGLRSRLEADEGGTGEGGPEDLRAPGSFT